MRTTAVEDIAQYGGTMADKPDINRASQEELERAEGIDQTMAEHIVTYREEHGPFRSAEDVKNVPGIGDTRLEQVRGAVSIPGDGGGQAERR
jgi:competence protein ComEA